MHKINRTFVLSVSFLLGLLVTAIAAPAQTFTTLYSFNRPGGDQPESPLVQGIDGNLFGTTQLGGAYDAGTVFRVAPNGTVTRLHNFDITDGQYPIAGLVQAADGNFYGTALQGGAAGYGTVFKINPSGKFTTLHSFDGSDGANPHAGLIQGTDGYLYGTTFAGGENDYGTIFKTSPGGALTTLHSFDGSDGANPASVLFQSSDGNLYGTAYTGGPNDEGTVFKITPSGSLTTLYSFCLQDGCPDGADPYAGLVQIGGNFYGTTVFGGAYRSYGAVFMINPNGILTTLHSFDSTDGYAPYGLVEGTDGNLYGTTQGGGANGEGTIFTITPSGTLTTLYNFCSQSGCADGRDALGGLVQDTSGIFYGTTAGGGALRVGTVFSLSVGLGPFVEAQPTSGKAGRPVKILGTNLTGATSVTFNGTTATFTVASPSLITTTVPAGATTGTVQVVTPGGTLSSNVPFRVIP